MTKHALPYWVGWVMTISALILIFPAFTVMLESHDNEIWDLKVERLGIIYTVGSLFFAFMTWIIVISLLILGINTIQTRDNSTTN